MCSRNTARAQEEVALLSTILQLILAVRTLHRKASKRGQGSCYKWRAGESMKKVHLRASQS